MLNLRPRFLRLKHNTVAKHLDEGLSNPILTKDKDAL